MKQSLLYTLIISLSFLSSCSTINLFQGSNHKDPIDLVTQDSTLLLSPGEKVTISVWQHDDLSVGSVFNIYNAHESFGKWVMVKEDSTLSLPMFGTISVRQLSTAMLEDSLTHILQKEIVNPVVVVKVLNREVTVLGEVKSPGNYLLDKDKTTLSEVIGKAEGFVSYADITKVQILRDESSYLIDMSMLSIPLANQIIIKPGDIVNVPSLKGKRLDQKAPTLIPFASAATSIAVVISLILR
jgi:polysaccharide export outer membrane protein